MKNVYKPQLAGTLIHAKTGSDNQIKSVTQIAGVALAIDRSGPYGEIANLVDQHMQREIGTSSDVMIAAQSAQRTFITCRPGQRRPRCSERVGRVARPRGRTRPAHHRAGMSSRSAS
ncbi:MAG: hypothetical protein HND48_06700 [Chloroflexi bacterium]|nr:hypothetical protein [Chloroflexota bacterium]